MRAIIIQVCSVGTEEEEEEEEEGGGTGKTSSKLKRHQVMNNIDKLESHEKEMYSLYRLFVFISVDFSVNDVS
jgi:hypothetical protein